MRLLVVFGAIILSSLPLSLGQTYALNDEDRALSILKAGFEMRALSRSDGGEMG